MNLQIFHYNDEIEPDYCSNTYVINDDNGVAVIIDPSKNYSGIVDYIKNNNLKPVAILLTHGHFDHIRGVKNILEEFNIPLYIHYLDADYLKDPFLNCSNLMSFHEVVIDVAPKLLGDNDNLDFFKEEIIRVIHTPFHTPGSVCYYLENKKWLFTGDSLFKNGVGRCDLPGGDKKQMKSSLDKLKILDNDVVIYPGHDNKSTIGHEKLVNVSFN